jgi:putative ABC transport system permease protein
MQTVLPDLRFALRQLRRAPGFALTAILTLALGIGANTAIFSLLDQALLRSLPVHDPHSLVVLEATGRMWQGHNSSNGGDAEAYFTYPMYRDLRDHASSFSGLVATAPTNVGFVHANVPQIVQAEIVSGNYFNVLGVNPALGQVFTQAQDVQPLAAPVAVLSFDFWRNHLAADPAIVGQTVTLNGHPFQIVGVAAPGFRSAVWGESPGVFVPMAMLDQIIPGHGTRLTDHKDKWMNILGRLKPGVSTAQAEAATAPLWHSLRAEEFKNLGTSSPRFLADFVTDSRLHILPGARGFSYSRNDFQKPLLAVMAMAVLLLIIASVNVASLLLVRSAGRVREFSLRAALGASSSRLVSQLLLEGLLIGLLGAIVGLLLAPAALQVLVSRLGDPSGASAFNASIDPRILLFNFAVAMLVSLLFSLAPALQLRRPNLTSALRESTGTGSGSLLTLRRVVVSLQVGLSVILLVSSGLFLRTLQKLRTVDVGFPTAHLVTFSIAPRLAGYTTDATSGLQQRILDSLAAIPGVQSVAATNDQVLANHNMGGNVTVAGYNVPTDNDYDVEEPAVTPGYLDVMQTPVIAGRGLNDDDNLTHPPVAVVNETFSRHFCGSSIGCLGRMMATGGGNKILLDTQIVGIVRDSTHSGPRGSISPTMLRPLRQQPKVVATDLYVRTLASPASIIDSIRLVMHAVDPALPITGLMTLDQLLERDLQNERLIALLAASFGALATLLAGIGLYGVLAYSTAQRTREIGIRMALGSSRIAVSSLILKDVLRLAALGVVLAIPVALGLGRLIRVQLFGVTPADPVILISVVAIITSVAFLAALIPARRAAAVEPTIALRTE